MNIVEKSDMPRESGRSFSGQVLAPVSNAQMRLAPSYNSEASKHAVGSIECFALMAMVLARRHLICTWGKRVARSSRPAARHPDVGSCQSPAALDEPSTESKALHG